VFLIPIGVEGSPPGQCRPYAFATLF